MSDRLARAARRLDWALAWAEQGFYVFPLRPNRKGFYSKEAVGAIIDGELKGGFYAGTRDPERIRAWWTKWPNANIGADCGRSGVVVLDADVKGGEDGIGSYNELAAQTNLPRDTWTVETPSGGQHAYYRANGFTVGSSAAVCPGLDVRAQGGLVILPPSRTKDGDYHFALGCSPSDLPMADCSPELAQRLGAPRPKRPSYPGSSPVPAEVVTAYRGQDGYESGAEVWGYCPWCPNESLVGESSLNRETGAFHCFGCDESAGWRRLATKLGVAPPQPPPAEEPHTSDTGNAMRLAQAAADRLRFVPGLGWLGWDGQRWARDEGIAWQVAREVPRLIAAEAAECADDDRRKALLRWALTSESTQRTTAMLRMAESEPTLRAAIADFDADPWLLNVGNGTLDLRTGQLRTPAPADHITALAPVAYDPDATSPVLDRYLEAVAGDDDFRGYLQRAIGYTLTGLTWEETFFMCLGPGGSGKTTLVEALLSLLGDYAAKASFETFLVQDRTGAPRPDLARLRGARLVAACETEPTKRLAEAVIKELTGGDTITARHLYQEEFSFKPVLKLWLAANNAPKVSDRDSGTWRRLRRVPFEHAIADPDPTVKASLSDPEHEAARALFAWAVRGCQDWQRDKLGSCALVTRRTAALRAEMDPLSEFFAECCVFDPDATAPAKALRSAYVEWAANNGIRGRGLVSNREWGERLRERGCENVNPRDANGRRFKAWAGIGIVTDAHPEPEPPAKCGTDGTDGGIVTESPPISPHVRTSGDNPSVGSIGSKTDPEPPSRDTRWCGGNGNGHTAPEPESLEERVLEALGALGQAGYTRLAAELGQSPGRVRTALLRLADADLVRKLPAERYELAAGEA